MSKNKAFKFMKVAAVVFLVSLPICMILAYDGNRIASTYCNGLNAFSGIVLDGLRKVFEGLENVLSSAMQK